MATNDSGSSTRKKSTSKKSTGTTSTSKKSTSTRSTSKKSTSRAGAPRAESRPTPSATEIARSAARELLELTGKQPEGITGLERTEDGDGWNVQVEVVEVRRIPDTTDVLALYEITTDERGRLQGYRRLKRYARGVPGED